MVALMVALIKLPLSGSGVLPQNGDFLTKTWVGLTIQPLLLGFVLFNSKIKWRCCLILSHRFAPTQHCKFLEASTSY
jgi:hypothetical protein